MGINTGRNREGELASYRYGQRQSTPQRSQHVPDVVLEKVLFVKSRFYSTEPEVVYDFIHVLGVERIVTLFHCGDRQ